MGKSVSQYYPNNYLYVPEKKLRDVIGINNIYITFLAQWLTNSKKKAPIFPSLTTFVAALSVSMRNELGQDGSIKLDLNKIK